MSDVSVLGLGNMGTALAKSLLASGRSVTVWNRSAEKAQPLAEAGAEIALSVEDALAASDIAVSCLKNHETVTELLRPVSGKLTGKTILDLSTGGAEEAEELVDVLTEAGADWLIGMINAYPSGIGKAETSILCASPNNVWDKCGDIIRTMGGASDHVGTTPAAVPGLFAAMFTARQGFMFGMIYGGAVCRRAGVPMEVFAAQLPVTLGMAGSYAETFRRTVPAQSYDKSEATLAVYLAALNDVLSTFESTGTADDFPRLMRDLTQSGIDKGLAAKDLTVLVEMLSANA
ncbi:MAG: NAD(P)-dependent oxidoreductase [Silicimonas sp.]|nr:NAD(P)-dependent oxidoreductase [Silicimonas sp.]